MGGILLLLGFELAGVTCVWNLAKNRGTVIKIYLGLSAGLVMMMWLPAILAFFIRFTLSAQLIGLAIALAASAGVFYLARNKNGIENIEPNKKEMPLWLLAVLVIPLTVLGGYLLYTHIIRPENGAYWCGQCTYGDLCLHLAISTSLRNAQFPPMYNLIQGVELGYPFLSDSLVTSMLLAGTSLRGAFVISGTLMMALVFAGFALFTFEITGSKAACAVAQALMFLNGGFGFLYMTDKIGQDTSRFYDIFNGYYLTPTNLVDKNIRWSNVIADMMIPQRTLLGGWMALMPCLFLLTCALKRPNIKTFICLGILGGALPIIHTHSFLALALLSLGAFVYSLIISKNRKKTLFGFIVYGAIAAVLAVPQVFKWSIPQTVEGGSLKFLFNWVNNSGNGLIDDYLFFWIKNVGIVFLCAIPAVLNADREYKALGIGAAVIFIVAELFVFQRNVYDNNKLFYVVYIALTPLAAGFIMKMFDKLKGLKVRVGLLALIMILGTLSGVLTLGREAVSEYMLFSPDLVTASGFIEDDTEEDAIFLTGTQHINPVASLCGRQIVCGTDLYLYFHGIDTYDAKNDVRRMYEEPENNKELFDKYDIDYVFVSSYEYNDYNVNWDFFDENWIKVYESGEVTIYRFNDRP